MSDAVLLADWPAPANIRAGTTLRAGSEADLPAVPRWLRQVHGARAVLLGSPDFDDEMPEADAVIGTQPGDICVVRTADCLPVLLCSRDGQQIAAVHAGWRGLAAGVIEAAIERLSYPPSALLAWIGPAIAQPAFEVGDEVREQFVAQSAGAQALFIGNDRGRWQADLCALARRRLGATGVRSVHGGGLCTFADSERFFSFRRDGQCGRMATFIHRQL